MPIKKLPFKPGVNRENTRYTSEGGWYESDKVRFRQGLPEKIGGWIRFSGNTFLGTCRSLLPWADISGVRRIGVGTHLKYYVEQVGAYTDITPLANTQNLALDPFGTTSGSASVVVTDASGNFSVGDYVTFSGATAVNGLTLNGEYVVQAPVTATTYTIDAGSAASGTGSGGGGAVVAEYQLSPGLDAQAPGSGWGSNAWSSGTWGLGTPGVASFRIWNHSNFGEDLIFGPRDAGLYYWDKSVVPAARGVPLQSLSGASDVPVVHRSLLVSDVSRFVIAFGCNELGDTEQDPMLIRWSDQENAVNWTPAATNQAGGIRLSRGSQIITAQQARQEILVWTDTALYSMQYVGPPEVWSTQLLAENISIISDRAISYANGVAYWMGRGKFYRYDGRVTPLPCDLRKFIFDNINMDQFGQVFAGNNEQFHEVWWFYCVGNSLQITNYVVFNYLENVWYYGTLGRTAWVENGLVNTPVAATYSNNLVQHEMGIDDEETASTQPIDAFIESSQFDLDDGHQFMFVRRVLPDINFEGSTAQAPAITMRLLPLRGSGSGYRNPLSVGGESEAAATRIIDIPVDQYTNQLFIRARGRQMTLRVESDSVGVQWQLGYPRLDMQPFGRK